MRTSLGLAVLVAGVLTGTGAYAADLPARTYTKAPPPAYVAPIYNWTGLYVGVHGGYGWGHLDAGALGSTDQNGGFVGGQVGYNWQPAGSPWVFGLEFDSAWANIEDSYTATAGGVTASVSSDVDYLGSFRGRVGYAGWDPRLLLYVTGGLGWAHNEISAAVTFPGVYAAGSVSNTHVGYTVGGGLEYAISGPWSLKAEYLYYGLGDENYGGVNADLNIHTVKVGLNYRFGLF